MNPENLDEKTQNWHADATLPPTLRARLGHVALAKKAPQRTLALRYGLAGCLGVSLGLGFVVSRQHATKFHPGSLGARAESRLDFARIAKELSYWRGPHNARYEVILFLDMECPSCRMCFADVLRLPNTRLSICHFPFRFHHHAKALAVLAEEAGAQGKFWEAMTLLEEGTEPRILTSEALGKALRLPMMPNANRGESVARIEAMQRIARASGISETPTFWVRDVKTGQLTQAIGFRQLKALLTGPSLSP